MSDDYVPRPARTAPWPRGGGRVKGVKNKATIEAKTAARAIVDDPKYRAMLLKRARRGTIPPAVETMLWYYARGKPQESIKIDGDMTVRTIESLRIEALHMDYDQLKAATDVLHVSNTKIAELLGLPPVEKMLEPVPDEEEQE